MFTSRLHAGILRDWLADHVLHGEVVLPGAALMELACAAASHAHWMASASSSSVSGGSSEVVCVEGFSIVRRVVAADVREGRSGDMRGLEAQATTLRCVVGDDGETEIYSEDGASAERVLHASGRVSVVREDGARSSGKAQASKGSSKAPDWQALSELAKQAASSCDRSADIDRLYRTFVESGLKFGEAFRLLRTARYSERACVCSMSVADTKLQQAHMLPPNMIDVVLQSSAVALTLAGSADASSETASGGSAQVPYAIDEVWIRPDMVEQLWQHETCTCHVEIRQRESRMTVFDCSLLSAEGCAVMHMKGVYARTIEAQTEPEAAAICNLTHEWTPLPRPSLKEIHMSARGSLENLVLRDAQYVARELAADEVEVKVCASSLNFRDVLNVLGMYPGDPGLPGCEFAGIVTRVGRAVERFRAGDEVMGMGQDCLRDVVVQNQVTLHAKPSTLSMEEAAAIPVVFCTVDLALREQ